MYKINLHLCLNIKINQMKRVNRLIKKHIHPGMDSWKYFESMWEEKFWNNAVIS